MNIFNWHIKLNALFCLSVSQFFNNNNINSKQPTAAQIAAEMAKINPTLIKSAPRSTAYNPNPSTMQQLAQFQPQQGFLSAQNPIYQQYLAKMGQYGAGAGKTAPSQSQSQGNQ